MPAARVSLGSGIDAGEHALERLVEDRFASRLFARDATLWGPAAVAEASNRLGWVDAPGRGDDTVADALALRNRLAGEGVDRIVLCGMGGSSLAPEVIAHRDGVPLVVLDSTHPDQIRAAVSELARTAVIVSSKSGSTVETRSQLASFEAAFAAAQIDAASRIVIVTDPGSALADHAATRGYRTFLADPEVGGRYSAFTAFGLVPAVLAGADGRRLLEEARAVGAILGSDTVENPALQLAAALATALPQRFCAGVYHATATDSPMPDWIEQLVAESTGKDGRGLLPIALTADAPEVRTGPPATQGLIALSDAAPDDRAAGSPPPGTIAVEGPLGAQLFTWEVATAALGRLIGVDPFDQPDVEAAKVAARALLAQGNGAHADPPPSNSASALLAALSGAIDAEGYLVIQAFLDRATTLPLRELRAALAETLGVPVALGFGPRYLHSTGQFHKGGPRVGVFLQFVEPDVRDEPIPGEASGYAALIRAQAHGDREVLTRLGRPVFTEPSELVAPLLAALRVAAAAR